MLCKYITSFGIPDMPEALYPHLVFHCSSIPAHLYHQGFLVDVAPPENSGSDGESKTESEPDSHSEERFELVEMLNNELKGMGR